MTSGEREGPVEPRGWGWVPEYWLSKAGYILSMYLVQVQANLASIVRVHG